jgi:transcriptional regulator with PAS, ATPase and Fis domain
MKKGAFREDLYYRLNVIPLFVPPLRERKDDILLLASHFLEKFSQGKGKDVKNFSPEVLEIFFAHTWPGNVRELENTIEHAVIVAKKRLILPRDLPQSFTQEPEVLQRPFTLLDHERDLILKTLETTNWNKHQTAKKLNITRSTLYGKIKRYSLEREHN